MFSSIGKEKYFQFSTVKNRHHKHIQHQYKYTHKRINKQMGRKWIKSFFLCIFISFSNFYVFPFFVVVHLCWYHHQLEHPKTTSLSTFSNWMKAKCAQFSHLFFLFFPSCLSFSPYIIMSTIHTHTHTKTHTR